jgi:hypothetical protein
MSRANEPAYPVSHDPSCNTHYGLTIREHVTIEMVKAMIGTAAAPCLTGLGGAEGVVAEAAARMADALLSELSKGIAT